MNENNKDYVSAGKPKVGGAIFWAPAGTPVPTSATEELDAAFENLGYVSADGLSDAVTRGITEERDWSGSVINSEISEYSDKYKYKLLEATNPEVLKHAFGSENVSGTLEKGLHLKVGPVLPGVCALVVDTIHKGYMRRQVVQAGQVTEIGEIKYVSNASLGYEITLSAYTGSDGYSHHEYTVARPKTT